MANLRNLPACPPLLAPTLMQEKIDYVRSGFVALLRQHLAAMPAAAWGQMGFQQMVEHLVLSVKSASGKISRPLFTPEDQLPKWVAFLRDDAKAFRENTKSPALPADPLPLHFSQVGEAVDKLESELDYLFAAFGQNPALAVVNPVFGPLDFELTILLLNKHFHHHARQFGLE